MSEWIIGIDPGASGGIACMGEGVDAMKMSTEVDVADELRSVLLAGKKETGKAPFAFLEKVHAMPKQGVTSTFAFGQSYGFLRGCLIALGIPFEEVTPQKWQKAMGCLSKGDKNVTKARARQLFPGIKMTHAIADALLIAEYGRRLRTGTLGGEK